MPWTVIACEQVIPEDIEIDSTAIVHLVHIRINNIQKLASSLIQDIGDTSWVSKLDVIPRIAFEAAATRTADVLIKLFRTVSNNITSEFGEYAISLGASQVLNVHFDHKRIPLAELWKSQVSGNPGFDFHTESTDSCIVFGEAKYKSRDNAYGAAAKQVVQFLADKKHQNDIVALQYFASPASITKLVNDIKGIALAFSLNTAAPEEALHRALENANVRKIVMESNEIYLIGVQV